MKKVLLVAGLMLVSFSSFAQSKIGTIDAEYIIAQLPENASVDEGLKSYNRELQSDLEKSIQEYEKLVKDYQENVRENAAVSEEDRKKKETEIINLENNIKGFRQKASVMMQMKRNELTEPLYEKINAAMLQVITEEGYTQVFHAGGNSLAYSAESHDITLKVLQKLGIEVQAQ